MQTIFDGLTATQRDTLLEVNDWVGLSELDEAELIYADALTREQRPAADELVTLGLLHCFTTLDGTFYGLTDEGRQVILQGAW